MAKNGVRAGALEGDLEAHAVAVEGDRGGEVAHDEEGRDAGEVGAGLCHRRRLSRARRHV
jgi:hypothetical protein